MSANVLNLKIRSSKATVHSAPAGAALSARYSMTVDGQSCPVYKSPCSHVHYAYFDMTGEPVDVVVKAEDDGYWDKGVVARPLSKGIAVRAEGHSAKFSISTPGQLSLERAWITGNDVEADVLFLYANPPAEQPPQPDDENVIYFGPGLHEIDGDITIHSGMTLYIAGGSIVRAGGVRATNATDITIRGRGVLELSLSADWDHSVIFRHCRKVTIDGVAVFSHNVPPGNFYGHQNFLVDCDDVVIRNYKTVGTNACDDGIHFMGCANVTVEDCFIRSNDDCLPIYCDAYGKSHRQEVGGYLVRRCVFWPVWQSGVCRIGWGDYPLPTSARGIVFRDCDVIHMYKGNMPEHALLDMREFAGRPSLIQEVIFENIRMEEVDTLLTVYHDESKSARLRNILLKDIQMAEVPWRTSFKGRKGSTFFGSNDFDGITFRNVTVQGKSILSPEQIGMCLQGIAALDMTGLSFLDADGTDHCPVARVSATPISGPAPLNVHFDATGSSSPVGTLASYEWDFGDGEMDTGAKVSHVYRKLGRHTVRLTVRNDEGVRRSTELKYVYVASRGLRGEYFARSNLTQHAVQTVDALPDLHWGQFLPYLEAGASDYSIRWSGLLTARYSQRYTFSLSSGGGVRLWVDGNLLIDHWNAPGGGTGTIDLRNTQPTELRLEYRDLARPGFVKLLWSSDSQAQEVVPYGCLCPWSASEATTLSAPPTAAPPTAEIQGFLGGPARRGEVAPVNTESWNRMKQAGYEFVPTRDMMVNALGRALAGDWSCAHVVRLWSVDKQEELATIPVWISSPVDRFGARHEWLPAPVLLRKGVSYRITSTEYAGQDCQLTRGDLSGHSDAAVITRGVSMTSYDGFPEYIDPPGEGGSGPPTFYVSKGGS